MKFLGILMTLMLFIGCQEKEILTANTIVEKAIAKACSDNCDHAEISFIFRDIKYNSVRNAGKFQFERIFTDSLGLIRDVLSNEGFQRYRNDSLVAVVDTMASKYASSVNSVHYFIQLPYSLKDPAVQKQLHGETSINGKPYYKIGVTFQKEGGGEDFEDQFMYWIHKEDFTVDYLAYSYQVDGGGIRFREAYNVRNINGIRFADYNNYKPKRLEVPLTELDILFQQGKLELLSKIESENIQVTLLYNE